MQNCYVADAGDFSKYLLLKNLCKNDLRLGVNWCLVDNETNNDGKHISYLEKYKNTDTELIAKLKAIIDQDKRDIREIQNLEILPAQTLFFDSKIPEGTKRFEWFKESLSVLENAEIIFFDPDNGLEVNSCGKLHPKSKKYVYFDEIYNTFEKGKSIIIYQHTNRTDNVLNQADCRVEQLRDCLNSLDKNISVDVFFAGQGTSRFYIVLKNRNHIDIIDNNLSNLKSDYLSEIFKYKSY